MLVARHIVRYNYKMEQQTQLEIISRWLGTGSINIFGRPFAGKDSQGRKLADLFDGILLGGGDILRSSTIPEHVRKLMHDGQLIPSSDYIDIVLPYLSQESLKNHPLILSSVGRWHGEETGVIRALEEANHPLKAVVYLSLNEDDVHARWHEIETHQDREARHDDLVGILDTRLSEFEQKTIPVIDYYRSVGLLIEVDGSDTRENVKAAIIDGLASHALASQ